MRMTMALLGAVVGLGLAVGGPATAANLITNGGFEDGSYTQGTIGDVPTGWTANSADAGGYFGVDTYTPHSGNYDLQIGNYDADPVEMASQTFSDVAGGLYTVNFYGLRQKDGDPNAYLSVSAGGQTDTMVEDAANYGAYEQGTFTFIGKGSDTLTIAAATNPGDWYIDDVSVNGPPAVVSATPEPSGWVLMIVGVGMAGAGLRYQRQRAVLRYA